MSQAVLAYGEVSQSQKLQEVFVVQVPALQDYVAQVGQDAQVFVLQLDQAFTKGFDQPVELRGQLLVVVDSLLQVLSEFSLNVEQVLRAGVGVAARALFVVQEVLVEERLSSVVVALLQRLHEVLVAFLLCSVEPQDVVCNGIEL